MRRVLVLGLEMCFVLVSLAALPQVVCAEVPSYFEPWQAQIIGDRSVYPDLAIDGGSPLSDYTMKICGSEGGIGGASDEFGYLYQRFTGDNRIIYRSRMQDASQFGIVLKTDLSPNGITYFFGGNRYSEQDEGTGLTLTK